MGDTNPGEAADPPAQAAGAEPPTKRLRLDEGLAEPEAGVQKRPRGKVKGMALVKEEYLIATPGQAGGDGKGVDDDAAEGRTATDSRDGAGDGSKRGKKKKQRGQNQQRDFGRFADAIRLCNSLAHTPEFSPRQCTLGERCKGLHDLRQYLKEGRRGDIDAYGGKCPVFAAYGRCPSGWRCRFLASHMDEVEREDGRKELVLVEDADRALGSFGGDNGEDMYPGVVNVVRAADKADLEKKRAKLDKSERYNDWLEKDTASYNRFHNRRRDDAAADDSKTSNIDDYRAQYVEPPFKPSEKRRIYFGRETPVLAPLTTQGNLPFRRLCVELGAQATYSEMALGLPLIQGQKADWAVMRAHESETLPPRVSPTVVQDYDNSRDLKFGAQIATNAPWIAVKAAEALARYLPHLRVIDVNCGCPIDMVYKSGAGSALLDSPAKLDRMVRGMNAVSGEIPITTKIRMGVRDGRPTAHKVVERLAFGNPEMRDVLGAPGCAAVTLHGRTRQQRYTKVADWSYIAECATLIRSYGERRDELADTVREADASTQANTARGGDMYFLGNGDCYSHLDYFRHIDEARVDSVMIGRGALLKPWIFEEIEKGQLLDKSASERLAYIDKFCRYGLEAWGSDELGIGFTRRFLLEFLSFFYRYIPLGILEHTPASLNDRPPAYRGRNDLETLLASDNYRDWIKISEMFLGPVHPDFKFQPKHKSNSYEIDAEG